MKKSTTFFLSLFVAAFGLLGVTACSETPAQPTTYKVTYVAGEGTGTAPEEKSYVAGTEITVAENTFTYEGYTFTGWLYNETVYEAGAKYIVPKANTVFTAQWEANEPEAPTTYKVTYVAGGGTGSAPTEKSYEVGEQITLAANTFTYEGYTFAGWIYNDTVYNAGATFTVPAENVEFTAKWEEIIPEPVPTFRQESYSYDRWAAGDMELTLDLDGSNLCYVYLDDEMLFADEFSYNEETGCLVLAESVVLALTDGSYTVTAITDAGDSAAPTCTIVVDNSVKTAFDEERTKAFNYGYTDGVTFSVDFNGTEVVSITYGDITLDEKYYTVEENSITLKSEWLRKFNEEAEHKLVLSNNDIYTFTVTSNILFATDYDVNTIHSTVVSNVGINPLYQYFDNVEIVEGPKGMEGKVLKITPNTVEVQYDCNGYITLGSEEYKDKTTWYNVGFVPNKNYAISFDYMTEGTSNGTFVYKDPHSGWSRELLLGAENDGIVHHFSATVNGSELKHGLCLYANFIGGGGCIYVDNFRVSTFDALPTVTASGDYNLSGDYTVTVNSNGLVHSILLNGNSLEEGTYTYNEETGALTLKEAFLATVGYGKQTVSVVTEFVTVEANFQIIDNRVVEFTTDTVNYSTDGAKTVRLYGSITEGITLVSVKQYDKNYNSGYKDDYGNENAWDFSQADTEKNYASLVTLVSGLDGAGYLELSEEFLSLFWGDTKFAVEFSNGVSRDFTLKSDVLMFTNYDDTTLWGYFNGSSSLGGPLNSGLTGNSIGTIEERESGNKAFYIRSTEGAQDATAFSVKFRNHPWSWFTAYATEGTYLRITFTYQISGLAQDSVYLKIMAAIAEDKTQSFYGDYDAIDEKAGYNRMLYHLIADGEVHTFDSGWFLYDNSIDYRMTRIVLPSFTAADNAFVMFDDYKIVQTARVSNLLNGIGDYAKGQEEAFGFDTTGESVTKILVNGEVFTDYTVDGNVVTFSKEELSAMDCARYSIKVYTNNGVYRGSFSIIDSRVANLTETNKDIIYGVNVTLAGEFAENLTVTSVTRQGADTSWDPSCGTPVQLKTSYVTVTATGLILSRDLTDHTYKTAKYVVTFDNGKAVEFTLNSNVIYYSDYDETNVYVNIPGNSVICQDSSMRSIVEVDGNRKFKYEPANATLGHSVGALNGARDNFVFTFENRTNNQFNWYDYSYATNEIVVFFFDYEVVAGDKNPNYQFEYIDINGQWNSTKLSGKGSFYIELFAKDVRAWGINCPSASIEDVRDTYMLIDNIGFGKKVVKSLELNEYGLGATEAYTIDMNGLEVTEVLVNGSAFAYTQNNSVVTLDATALAGLELGVCEVVIRTADGSVYCGSFTVVDNRVVATLNDKAATFVSNSGKTVKLYGSFSENAVLESAYRVRKNGDIYEQSFAQDDTTINYNTAFTVVPGLDGTGYIEIPTSFLDILWGTSQVTLTYNSGITDVITLMCNTMFYTDYDETGMYAKYEDGSLNFSHEMNSGLFTWNGCVAALQEREAGNKAFYVLNSENAEAPSIFTIKTHEHPWGWYPVYVSEGAFRVTFTYQICGLEQGSVFFYVMSAGGENKGNNFFGDYDELVYNQNDNYHQVRWYLNTDGNVHTFDSGWINANTTLRMMQINVSKFAPADGRFVMVDDYRFFTGATATNVLSGMGDYVKGQEEAYGFDTTGKSVTKILVNGEEFTDYTVDGGVVTFSKEKLSAMDCANYELTVYTNGGTFRGSFSIVDTRVASLTETNKRIVYGEVAKLAGEFDTTLTVTSVTRQGADTSWDSSNANPVQLKTSYVTVAADGLELSLGIVNHAYKTGKYTVSFDNGKTVEFTLESNVIYYSDYDETNVYVNIPGNSVICQDSSMRELVEVDGNHMLKYTPANATLGHSTAAINGNGDQSNYLFTFENLTLNSFNWYGYTFKSNDVAIFFFDYEVVAGDKTPNYQVRWMDATGTFHTTALTGSGTFYVELPTSNLRTFGINCPAASIDEVEGTYMYVDNVGFGVLETTKYLTETSKTVVQGTDTAITLAGNFGSDVAIVNVTRWGTNFWDASKTVLTEINKDYFTLSENGLTVSATLLNKVYDTMYFCVNLTNGDFVKFSLTSNVWWLSDYDEVYTHELSLGNVASCQDTSMWSVETAEDGNKYIKYAPEKATLGHATGGFDKRCFTFSNSTTGNTWWWQHALPTTGKLFVKFDYEIVITEAYAGGETVPPYEFRYWNVGGEHETAISGSGTFYIEIPLEGDAPGAWAIGCRSTALAEYAGTYMNIDNYMFGVVA